MPGEYHASEAARSIKPGQAVAGDDLAHLVATRDVGVQHGAEVAMKLRPAPFGLGFDLRGEVSALPPVERNRRRAASTFYYIILKLPTLRYTYFLSTQTA